MLRSNARRERPSPFNGMNPRSARGPRNPRFVCFSICHACNAGERRKSAVPIQPQPRPTRAPTAASASEYGVVAGAGAAAGTEAALGSARMGCRTLVLTHSIEPLGQMSCNPSIGGIGKGHRVKEIDALDGAMALATDEAGIQFRILNSSKGAAVRSTRPPTRRGLFQHAIRPRIREQA